MIWLEGGQKDSESPPGTGVFPDWFELGTGLSNLSTGGIHRFGSLELLGKVTSGFSLPGSDIVILRPSTMDDP